MGKFVGEHQPQHGMSDNPAYQSWVDMVYRCHSESSPKYPDYGGRGIKVYIPWRFNFDIFLEDMGEKPPDMTLDRIDNDGDYTPDNCRWATATQQSNNRKSNIRVEYGGENHTIAEWSRILGATYHHLKYWVCTKELTILEYMRKFPNGKKTSKA